MGEKDKTEKYLESYDDVFADIFNVLVFEENVIYNVPYKVDTTRERDCLKCWLPLGEIIDIG